jgi:(4S)-4-hydroxy-5-phosphonooxypentane-2,3-dione isomerase
VIVLVHFVTKRPHAAAFLARVRQQAQNSLALEAACHVFDVAVDPADSARVLLYEVYGDREAFNAHLRSAHFKAFDAEVAGWLESKVVELWDGPIR